MAMDVAAPTRTIRNPVLPGFHPDPSILRVGEDYYLATSTFEWYPGVRLHHSRDLVNWRPLGGILTEKRLLDLSGAGDSCGIWAPDLTYHDGRFYLVFTNVASFASGYWDPQNYVVWATDPAGPWSDPVALHSRGFDASFFHDTDGTTWLLSMSADWRKPDRDRFGGIIAQRYDRAAERLVGESHMIFAGTDAGITEGPHLYRVGDLYYLVTAEGGTILEHQVTVARSEHLLGPYQPDPAGPMLTSYGHPELTLQKAGHGSFVVTPAGEWYVAHLVGRPYAPSGNCVLGRETAIQPVVWQQGWPRVPGGVPADDIAAPDLPEHPWPAEPAVDDFDAPVLGPNWSTLRRPATPDWVSLSERPGFLRVYGGHSPVSRFRPSLVARRMTATRCEFSAVLEFTPESFRQLAGITAYYNTRNWHYLYLTREDDGRRVLEVRSCDSGRPIPYPDLQVDVTGAVRVGLRAVVDGAVLRFGYDTGDGWRMLPIELDTTILSDEYATRAVGGEPLAWGFTGAFVGIWVQDLGSDGGFADIDSARYTED